MTNTINPTVGDWYKNSNGDEFEVVALDEEDETIEIQYFDGTVEEIDMEQWSEDIIIAIHPPEDWSGSYDIDKEDFGIDFENQSSGRHRNPFEEFDR